MLTFAYSIPQNRIPIKSNQLKRWQGFLSLSSLLLSLYCKHFRILKFGGESIVFFVDQPSINSFFVVFRSEKICILSLSFSRNHHRHRSVNKVFLLFLSFFRSFKCLADRKEKNRNLFKLKTRKSSPLFFHKKIYFFFVEKRCTFKVYQNSTIRLMTNRLIKYPSIVDCIDTNMIRNYSD